ncbi:hypothetical protein MRB53_024995 [Persea americana]|uniref:Uncharacterized protein n=1 Tax=Persea americana TaxID=3435 RepID=A0ACC2LE78_PERAE|nr:hypothetical protein MRB53_024995 [Persea americana]
MMKRFRDEDVEGIHVANWLMLLSRGQHEPVAQTAGRVFECRTCNRQFSSFQALGGHRASHKKPRTIEDCDRRVQSSKPRVHECSICGLEFSIGQALGGHMRRHRNEIEGCNEMVAVKKLNGGRGFFLDLNLPPSENEAGYAGKIPFVH